MSIRHLWRLKIAIYMHRCPIFSVPFFNFGSENFRTIFQQISRAVFTASQASGHFQTCYAPKKDFLFYFFEAAESAKRPLLQQQQVLMKMKNVFFITDASPQ